MILIDTDVAIDILRKHPPAVAWITGAREPICLPGIVVLELYQGCHNRRECEALRVELASFAVLWPTESTSHQVLLEYPNARLSHSVGIMDALIAATAIAHHVAPSTFNQKHFAAFGQLTTVQPYVR